MKNWLFIILILAALGAIMGNCSCRNDKNSPKEYINAINEEDYNKAHEILDNLYAGYMEFPNSKKRAQKYWTAADYIYKAEMQWLLPQNDIEADQRLIYTLDAMNPPGIEPMGNYRYGLTEHNQKYENFNSYCSFVEEFNKLCLELIKIALRNDNLSLSETTLGMMKVRYTKINDGDTYLYEPNDADRLRAQELITQYKSNDL